jgi:hypothetical protein
VAGERGGGAFMRADLDRLAGAGDANPERRLILGVRVRRRGEVFAVDPFARKTGRGRRGIDPIDERRRAADIGIRILRGAGEYGPGVETLRLGSVVEVEADPGRERGLADPVAMSRASPFTG